MTLPQDIEEFAAALGMLMPRLMAQHRPRDTRLAITTGDVSASAVVNGRTFKRVAVYLDGVEQVVANKSLVTLPFGQADPGAGEFWVVKLVDGQDPGYLDKRLA